MVLLQEGFMKNAKVESLSIALSDVFLKVNWNQLKAGWSVSDLVSIGITEAHTEARVFQSD